MDCLHLFIFSPHRQNFLQFNTIQELEDLAKELKTRLKSHLKYSDVYVKFCYNSDLFLIKLSFK